MVEKKKKAVRTKKKVGRPTEYTPKLGDKICEGIANGIAMVTVCKNDETLPSPRTVYRWLRTHPEFCQNYEQAKEDQADLMVEEMVDIADNGTNDWMERYNKDNECIGWQINGEHVQRSRLRLDFRKWAASKFKPKKYGDKSTVAHEGNIGLIDLSDEELARKIQQLERAQIKDK